MIFRQLGPFLFPPVVFDTKCDGFLDPEELAAAFRLTGEDVENWEIDAFIADGDKNDDGRMDYEEWIDLMKHTPQI